MLPSAAAVEGQVSFLGFSFLGFSFLGSTPAAAAADR
jgi:hypothetical protein